MAQYDVTDLMRDRPPNPAGTQNPVIINNQVVVPSPDMLRLGVSAFLVNGQGVSLMAVVPQFRPFQNMDIRQRVRNGPGVDRKSVYLQFAQ